MSTYKLTAEYRGSSLESEGGSKDGEKPYFGKTVSPSFAFSVVVA